MNSKFTSALSVMQYRIWVSHAKVSACIVTAEIYPVITVISWKTLSKVGIVYALKLLEGEAVRERSYSRVRRVKAKSILTCFNLTQFYGGVKNFMWKIGATRKTRNPLIFLVEKRGFEPPTPALRRRCSPS